MVTELFSQPMDVHVQSDQRNESEGPTSLTELFSHIFAQFHFIPSVMPSIM